MKNIDLSKISSFISQKAKKPIEILDIEKIGSGEHSDGYKLTAKNGSKFFLKKIKINDAGFEIPERKIMSLLVGNGMARRANFPPKPIGIVLDNGNETLILPEIDENTVIYQIQELESEGSDYWETLQKRKTKDKVDKEDMRELEKITDYIAAIHKIKHPSKNKEQLKAIYNDSLRAVLTNPELTIMLLNDFSKNHPILPISKHKDFVGQMLDVIYKWLNRSDRLTALHGDFWGANLFFKKNNSIFVIDYSRIPWGDPGIDIGQWLSQYLWLYHETQNDYFKELGETFLDMYAKKAKDNEIRKAVSLILGLMGVIDVSPRLCPNLDIAVGKRFFDNILEIMKNNQFVWKK